MTEYENKNSNTGLVVEDIHRSFRWGDSTIDVLKGVSFQLRQGDSMAVLGPSGCGKSTLLQIIGALDKPDRGYVRVGDVDSTSLSSTEQSRFRNEKIGFVFQDHHLLPQLTVRENVLIPTLAFGTASQEDCEYADDLIDSVGLSDRRNHRPDALSGGQRERVAIARSLIMKPTLILADEPTGNLDPKTAEKITELLANLPLKRNAILVAVTHSMTLAEAMSRTAYIENGIIEDRSDD